MKALIWKELRENWKWAGLGAVLLGIAMYQAFFPDSRVFGATAGYDQSNGGTLVRKQFLLVTTFGFPVLGLLLGFLQLVPELRRDRWAALLHRPVRRTDVFLSKILAGTLLYLVGAGVPFGVMVGYVATPGSFAVPFLPGMIRPGLADLLTGFAYYFAAVAICLNRQGWRFAGVFLLGATIFLSTQVLDTRHFWAAVAGATSMTLLLFLAAWGAALGPHGLGIRPAVLAIAYAVAVVFGAFGAGSAIKAVLLEVIPSRENEWVSYSVVRDIGPVRVEYVGGQRVEVTGFDGRPIPDSLALLERVRRDRVGLNHVSSYVGDSHGWKPRTFPPDYRNTATYFQSSMSFQYPEREQWYFLVPDREWVGFRQSNRKAFSWFDGTTFADAHEGLAGAKWEGRSTRADGQGVLLLYEPTSLGTVDLQSRRIDQIAQAGDEPFTGFTTVYVSNSDPSRSRHIVALGLVDQLVVFDEDWSEIGRLPYTQDVGRLGKISLGMIDEQRFMVRYDPSDWIPNKEARGMPSILEEVNTQGEVLASYELEPLPRPRRFTSVTWKVSSSPSDLKQRRREWG